MRRLAVIFLVLATALRASFNVTTDIPWAHLWWANAIKAKDGDQVQPRDALGHEEILSQDVTSQRPFYTRVNWAFNGHPTIHGSSADFASLTWVRPTPLPQPYTVVVIGRFAPNLTGYSVLVGNQGSIVMYPWVVIGASPYEEAYTSGGTLNRNYQSNPALWHTVMRGATSEFGRNGLPQIGEMGTDEFTGFTVFRFPTAEAYYSDGELALLGVLPNAASDNPKWKEFLGWVEDYYRIPTVSLTIVINDGDSRNTGSGSVRPAAAGYSGAYSYALQWGFLLQAGYYDPVETAGTSKSGRTQADQNTDAATYVDPAFSESVCTKGITININAGNNDISQGASAATAYARVAQYILDRHAIGLNTLIGTIPTFVGIGPVLEAKRIALNSMIMGNGAGSDGVVDIVVDELNPNLHPENFHDDLTHFNALGNVVVKSLVAARLSQAPFFVNSIP